MSDGTNQLKKIKPLPGGRRLSSSYLRLYCLLKDNIFHFFAFKIALFCNIAFATILDLQQFSYCKSEALSFATFISRVLSPMRQYQALTKDKLAWKGLQVDP